MAFVASDLVLTGSHNGYGSYRYDTLDASSAVDASGYMNNDDDDLNLAVGDIIDVIVWSTAIRSGTISDVAKHIVVSVSAAGVVDLSDDLLGATLADTD
jgi:hypothetical protein